MANFYFFHDTQRSKTQNKPMKLYKLLLTQTDQNFSFQASGNWFTDFNWTLRKHKDHLER